MTVTLNKPGVKPSPFRAKRTILAVMLLVAMTSCRKSEYNKVEGAAYLRVFNTLNYVIDISTKGKPVPFLTMIIDPQTDASGLVTGGGMIGDFLDVRTRYAPPASNAAGTSYKNTEFPGKLKIPVAPVINGFDLSGWAQVPSGKHRFVFYTRPITDVPFLLLGEAERKAQTVIADTVLDLSAGEVYTMNLLEKNVATTQLSAIVYLRKEQFPAMAFADSLLYLNLYNLSAEGYAEAHPEIAQMIDYNNSTGVALKNEVNVYYSLFTDDVAYPYTLQNGQTPVIGNQPIPGYAGIPLQTLVRSHDPRVAPYAHIPLFATKDTSGGIVSRQWMQLEILPPGGARLSTVALTNESDEGRVQIWYGGSGHASGFLLPSLIRQVASGPYLQRSFATVTSIEFVNKKIYMTSIQRTYQPPQAR